MTEVEVGSRWWYSGAGCYVTVTDLLPGSKARVRWTTNGQKQPGRRFWLRPPQHRERTVRLSSLKP